MNMNMALKIVERAIKTLENIDKDLIGIWKELKRQNDRTEGKIESNS